MKTTNPRPVTKYPDPARFGVVPAHLAAIVAVTASDVVRRIGDRIDGEHTVRSLLATLGIGLAPWGYAAARDRVCCAWCRYPDLSTAFSPLGPKATNVTTMCDLNCPALRSWALQSIAMWALRDGGERMHYAFEHAVADVVEPVLAERVTWRSSSATSERRWAAARARSIARCAEHEVDLRRLGVGTEART